MNPNVYDLALRLAEVERLQQWWTAWRDKAVAAGAVDPRPYSFIACGKCHLCLENDGEGGFRPHACRPRGV